MVDANTSKRATNIQLEIMLVAQTRFTFGVLT